MGKIIAAMLVGIVVGVVHLLVLVQILPILHPSNPDEKPTVNPRPTYVVYLNSYNITFYMAPTNPNSTDCFILGIYPNDAGYQYSDETTRAPNPYRTGNYVNNYSGSIYGEHCGNATVSYHVTLKSDNTLDIPIQFDFFSRNGTSGYKIWVDQDIRLLFNPTDYLAGPTVLPYGIMVNYTLKTYIVETGTLVFQTGINRYTPPGFIVYGYAPTTTTREVLQLW